MERANSAICEPLCESCDARAARIVRFASRCANRAMREPLWRQTVDLTASFRTVFETEQNEAVESTVCRRVAR
eukprot:11172434-Lingulodinium_polyedra.AAC.1